MITLYGPTTSPFVRKVAVALNFKSIKYLHPNKSGFDTWGDPAFIKISPLNKVPALTDNDFAIADSSVICDYLENTYPQKPIYPKDIQTRAKALWIEEYADTKLQALGGKVFSPRVLTGKIFKQSYNEGAVNQALDSELPQVSEYLEGQLEHAPFFYGEQLSIADIAVTSQYINLNHAGVEIDKSAYPKLYNLVNYHCNQAYLKEIIEEENDWINAMVHP